MTDLSFYKGKKILVTGSTGFKGSWLCKILINAGAEVIGFALEPPTSPALYGIIELQKCMKTVYGDIRDLKALYSVFCETNPDIVIHMAAQSLVRESYINPVYTYDVNVMGTVNVLECLNRTTSVKSFLNITTDKVYHNKEWEWGYRENEELNGHDPYSNSKSCSELVTDSYRHSFFSNRLIGISTARAGNVIGGGDFARDRIIPDCIRAAIKKNDIIVRKPFSIRPYQHVLEPLMAYLVLIQKQYGNSELSGSYNIGPDEAECVTTGNLVTLFCQKWNFATGETLGWYSEDDGGPHEASYLKLDCSKAKTRLGWHPIWNLEKAMEKIIEWELAYQNNNNICECMERQIKEYMGA
ncbi:MAG: CDP-glucose 4,6-dehydratase [Herbinix sp.]|nr:CDP-glucose 4,6-dehydratase [Herbinix sp.]